MNFKIHWFMPKGSTCGKPSTISIFFATPGCIGDRNPSQQTGHGRLRQGEHIGPDAESQLRIGLFDADFMGRDVKALLDLRSRPALERLVV